MRPVPQAPNRRRLWLSAAVLILVCTGIAAGGDGARLVFRYEPASLDRLQIWRLLTGHLTHLGWSHLLLNAAALTLLTALFDRVLSATGFAVCLLVSALVASLGLYLFSPDLQWYVGLSGILHGLALYGGVRLLGSTPGIGGLLLAGLVAKLAFEQLYGPLPVSVSASGGPVVVAAHLFGAFGGAAMCLVARVHFRAQDSSV